MNTWPRLLIAEAVIGLIIFTLTAEQTNVKLVFLSQCVKNDLRQFPPPKWADTGPNLPIFITFFVLTPSWLDLSVTGVKFLSDLWENWFSGSSLYSDTCDLSLNNKFLIVHMSPLVGLRNIRILCVNAMSPCDGLRNIRSLCVNAMLKSNAGSNLSWVHFLASKEN